eukprot:5925939-Lingulodinium_polyedra.AAC.1
MCPHCGQAEETAEHRFWACPRWDRLRTQAIGGAVPRALRRRPPAGAAVTGLLPAGPVLEAMAEVASGRGPAWPG